MARQFLVEEVRGWLAPLPTRSRANIAKLWPALSIDRIENEYGWYLLVRTAFDAQPRASEIEKRYTKLQEIVSDLRKEITWLDRTNLGSMVEQASLSPDHFNILRDTNANLTVLAALLSRARKYLPEGHQPNPRHLLTQKLVPIVLDAGLPVDKRPKGPLCQVLEILLLAAEETPTSVVEIVKPVLDRLKKTPPK